MTLYDLKTNNLKENNNVDRQNPVFGWKVRSSKRDICQESYRVRVWTEDGNPVWDSGCVKSSRMSNIPYEGKKLVSGGRYLWTVDCVFSCAADFNEDAGTVHSGEEGKDEGRIRMESSEESFFETGYFNIEDWKGCFIGETRDHVYHLFRKAFVCCKKIRRAKLYVCGMGHFECWLNGRRVSDHVLEPGWSVYDKTCFYTAYDVTQLLGEGGNAVLVKLGDGMFNVPGGRYVYYERSYGKCKLLAQLEIEYEDGSRELVVTDGTWKMAPSPVLFCCIYGGEDYDGRLWKEEYLQGDYIEEDCWEPAVCVEPPKGRLAAMPMEPMKVMQSYEPVSVREVRPGVWLYDLGVNFAGWVRIKLHTDGCCAGQKVVMKPAELLDREGNADQRITVQKYAWTYILNGEKEQEFVPDFTYTGFRYVEVSGAVPQGMESAAPAGTVLEKESAAPAGTVREKESAAPAGTVQETEVSCGVHLPVIVSLKGEFLYPDVEQAGEFRCSNQLFNDIHKIVLQAILSNTKSYFTDCPHREKLGWLEETHLIGPSIMYNLDVHNLYDKVEQDMADSQRDNGMVSDICPEYVTGFGKWHEGFVDSPEWGSACILNPWYIYKRYGDISMLERYYDVMKGYLNYLGSRTHHEVLHHGLGDWLDIGPCSPHSQNTPVPVVATCIYYYDLSVMKQAAKMLGRIEDAEEYGERMERVFREYNLQFLDDQTGRYATGSQAAQAMSLIVGLVPGEMEEKVIKELRNDVTRRGYAITAGDVGHPFLIAALMKYGMSDLVNEMTNITETPGYGYQVANGATTLTEDWDGPNPQGPHGSQNHLMLGSIEEWFYGGLGGMELLRSGLAFDEIRIQPHPEKGVDWARAWTMHPYGKISVEWKRLGREVEVTAQVPPNVTAHLESPDGSVKRIVGSGLHTYRFLA